MKSVIICIFLSIISIELSAHRLNLYEVIGGDYERIKRTENLPKVILDGFVKKGWCIGLGEFGEAFNESDVIQQHLPCSRLISAGNKDDYWYVYYEKTTRSHSHRLKIFKILNGQLINTWGYASSFQNSINFQDAIKKINEQDECFVLSPEHYFSQQVSKNCILEVDPKKIY
jgi:hypothetical protein